jgi:hypothetical protein
VGAQADHADGKSCYVYVWKVRGFEIELMSDDDIETLVDTEMEALEEGTAGALREQRVEKLKKSKVRLEGLLGGRKLIVVMYGVSGKCSKNEVEIIDAVQERLDDEARDCWKLFGCVEEYKPAISWSNSLTTLEQVRGAAIGGRLGDLAALIREHDTLRWQQAEWLEIALPTLLGVPLPPSIIHHFKRAWHSLECSKHFGFKHYPVSPSWHI